MSTKILGLDLGTGSIGTALRNPDLSKNITEQMEYYSSDIFNSGVGNGKSGEYSFAAIRTSYRQGRRLKQNRRRRIWETLKYLIQYGYCPLTEQELKHWRDYDKENGHQFPIDNKEFADWIRMDFDRDGVSDCTPFALRAELMQKQFDFSQEVNRYKLGRALFHIAQHRGFKSSKGETIAEQEKTANNDAEPIDVLSSMKASEEKSSKDLLKFMREHGLDPETHTVGEGFAAMEREGIRIRDSKYKAVRAQFKDEITKIFNFQAGLDTESEFYKHIISEKKGVGCIFYKNPLRSQKGTVGKCTLEPNKSRCPISHPVYEEFRAWSLLNNIKYKATPSEDAPWLRLPAELKESIYEELFLNRVKPDFPFSEIREKLQRRLGITLNGKKNSETVQTINYKDNVSVSGCPITARLKKLLGENWQSFNQPGDKQRKSHSKADKAVMHAVSYTVEDIWSVCYNASEKEEVSEFALNRLKWSEERAIELLRIWSSMKEGYAMLSRKAMENINRMLRLGFIYSDAVMLAKIPEIIGLDNWNKVQDDFIEAFKTQIKGKIEYQKQVTQIVNTLIASYKSLGEETGLFAYKDFTYQLQDDDKKNVIDTILAVIGEKSFGLMDADEQQSLINDVTTGYQNFFYDQKRDYAHAPKLSDAMREYLLQYLPHISEKEWTKLYHPSMISVYKPVPSTADPSSLRLGRPDLGGIRNPVALRTLNVLRHKINAMLDKGMIDPEETRVVVETTRTLKDANERWAIEQYNNRRNALNKGIEALIKETYKTRDVNDADVEKVRLLLDQSGFDEQGNYTFDLDEDPIFEKSQFSLDPKVVTSLIDKYRLWLEQGCRCIYTGKVITLSNLFDGNGFDLEHTIPRSISFDSSQANLTICDAHYNRAIKKQHIPTELPNYSETVTIDGVQYPAIKPRLKRWEEKVERLRSNINYWSGQSKKAQDKARKDACIRQRHLWQMELDYWQDKLKRFTTKEVTQGFRNSQLIDTGIITRHAVAYLKSIFTNVEVQKGSVTADFRKILGIQSIDEKKDRSMHSHHAIDAAVLTCVPVAAKRERMLKLFYTREENKALNRDCSLEERALAQEIKDCGIAGNIQELPEKIEKTIIVNHRSFDRTLAPASKWRRKRGKIATFTLPNGEKRELCSKGDSIRGSLHLDSYYGAIVLPKKFEDGNKGSMEYETDADGNMNYWMVIRKPISSFEKIEELDTIVDPTVRSRIKAYVNAKMNEDEKASFKNIIKQEIWMLDANGVEIKHDKNGRPLLPIRHVRCRAKAGRGFLSKDKSLPVHIQICQSEKETINVKNRDYKKYSYAQNENNYLFLLYEAIVKGAVKRQSRIINFYEIAQYNKCRKEQGLSPISDINDLYSEPYFSEFAIKKTTYKLTAIVKNGDKVLLWENDPESLTQMNNSELGRFLYVVNKFNNTGSDHLYLKHHLDASGKEKFITLTAQQANCLFEHRDFEIDELGNITFK